MKKPLLVLIIFAIVLPVGNFVYNRFHEYKHPLTDANTYSNPNPTNKPPASNAATKDSPPEVDQIPVEAGFEITTKGTRRIFTDPRYHNQSDDVYITSADPSIVYAMNNATWEDFFESLPMQLTRECLTTGTGQVFCDGESGNLRFYLNGTETNYPLDLTIQEADFLKVVFE